MTILSQQYSIVSCLIMRGHPVNWLHLRLQNNRLYGTWKNTDVVHRKVETYDRQRIL
ncbi:MAG: hypothetical protein AAFQ91_18015 [Cyanobacteria bacterium J06621_15]